VHSSAVEAVYRGLLLAYPRSFRERHGDEMVRLFLEKGLDVREGRGRLGLPGHWLNAVVDLVRNGIGVRLDEARERRRLAGTPMANAGRGNQTGMGMDSLIKDVKYALRTLLKNPGFAIVATFTIALGIGANTAIFSVVRAVLLQPLPYDEPEELVLLWGELRNRDVMNFPMSPPDFLEFREGAEALDDLGAVFTFGVSLTGDGDPVQVDAGSVTTNFFSMLGVEPILGRSFIEEDGVPQPQGTAPGQPGALPGIVVLSHGLWQQRYGGAPDVIGRTIEIGGGPSQIVGVMPPDFELLMPPTAALSPNVDVWIAARIDFVNAPPNNVFLRAVGRLRDGATLEQLQLQVDRIASDQAADNQLKASAGYAVRVESLHEDLTAHVRPVLLALFGAVVFVLLIACANVSNLLLVRASGRDREVAVRAALGGSRSRLIRQMLIESGLIAVVGAVMGIVLASGGVSVLLALQPDNLPRMGDVSIDGTVLLFTIAAAGGAALLFGLLPAVQGSRVDLADALKERGAAGANATRRLIRNTVVIVEVALSLVLLIGAGLMVRSFIELTNVAPGYDPEGVLTFTATAPFATYPAAIDRANFNIELQRRLEAIPGVVRAASAAPFPLTGNLFNGRYGPEEALSNPEMFRQAAYRAITPGYFEAMGTRLLSGRVFSDADNVDSTAVVVVDERLAEIMWPAQTAIGKRFLIRATTPEPQWVEVIGVVEHQRAEDLATVGAETVYFTDHYIGAFGGTWAVKSGTDPIALVGTIRTLVGELDADVPVADVELLQTYIDDAMGPTRFALTLIGIFGVVALLLASVGLYGVLSFVVRQRTAEIGVRMAFGAESGSILKLVVGQGLKLAGGGVVLGLIVAVPVTGVMESMLVGVTPTDPLTFGAISLIFGLVAALACYLPARRATYVNPVTALRQE
jgi:putative ABC transport system permease protein